MLWNQKWRAPTGPHWGRTWPIEKKARSLWARALGPFAFQGNSSTRTVEYPWAFQVAPIIPGLKVVELGGALSGFQYVLAAEGAHVTNVDPFVEYGADTDDVRGDAALRIHSGLNLSFGTDVKLTRATLREAQLGPDSVDRVYCISVIEHLAPDDVHATLHEVQRVLKPDGLFILTVDLFLNIAPFTTRARNQFGRNASILELVTESKLSLRWGKREELCGYPEFSTNAVLSNLEHYYIGMEYPVAPQLIVLQKAGPISQGSIAEGVVALRNNLFAAGRDVDTSAWIGKPPRRLGKIPQRLIDRFASIRT
jgi:SAM-dependent methyltransferase